MANTLGIDYTLDIGETIADVPSTLVWSGQTITGTSGPVRYQDARTAEVDFVEADLEWSGLVADFSGSTLPAVNAIVTVDGIKYGVTGYPLHGDGVGVILRLGRK